MRGVLLVILESQKIISLQKEQSLNSTQDIEQV